MTGGAQSVGNLEAFLGLDDSEFYQGIKRAQRTLNDVGNTMKSIGSTMSTFVTLPLIAAGGGAIKAAMDFEKAFSEIEGLVGVSKEEVRMLREEVLKLGGTTSRPPQELADALYFVTSAGFSGVEALDLVEKSAKAAAAGLGETQVIADLLSSVINAYGKEAYTAEQATNILVAAVREGKAEAPAMASALGYVTSIAATMGVEFEEVAAAVAAMTRTGDDASTATTNLSGILTAILDPTKEAKDALISMGTSASELRAVLRDDGLIPVLGFLKEQMNSNEDAMAKVFGNVRALRGALALVGSSAEANAQIFANLKNTTGDLDKAFNAAASTATFKFNQGMAELKTAAIQLGDALMPLFLDLVSLVKDVAHWFTGLSEEGKKLAVIVGVVAAAIGPLLIVLGSMATLFAAISIEVIAVVGAILGLAAGIIYISENWDAIKERISDWSWWRNVLINMIQWSIEYNPIIWLARAGIQSWNEMQIKIVNGLNFLIDKFNTFSRNTAKILGKDFIGSIERIADLKIEKDPWEEFNKGLELLKTDTKKYEHQFSSFTDSIVSFSKKAADAISGIFKGGGSGSGGSGAAAPGVTKTPGALPVAFQPMKDVTPITGAAGEALSQMKQAVIDLDNVLTNLIEGSLNQFAISLGNLLSGESSAKGFFNNLLMIVVDFAASFGKTLIGAGVAALAFKALLISPGAAIAAGIALVAATSAIRGMLKRGPGGGSPQGLAVGGYVTSGGVFQLHKDELVSLPRGSAVTPAHMAQGGGGGRTEVEVKGRIRGSDLDLLSKKTAYRKKRGG
jgi:TP901 family phage tail tape measure protein